VFREIVQIDCQVIEAIVSRYSTEGTTVILGNIIRYIRFQEPKAFGGRHRGVHK
jgi:hypothetical protein